MSLVRVVNSDIPRSQLKRPILFNHGLFESATIWLVNSRGVSQRAYNQTCTSSGYKQEIVDENDESIINVPMYLANKGYDCWLMSMRGTLYSRRHISLKDTDKKFWDYSLDDFALKDVPGALNYIQRKTKAKKIGYCGHSQATFSVFALLATKPKWANVISPVGAVAPVSYFDHITSLLRATFETELATGESQMGPFPPEAEKVRFGLAKLCHGKASDSAIHGLCNLVATGVSGKSSTVWLTGYYNHIPFSTSHKVLRHFGQLIKSRRFQMYDYGPPENQRRYGRSDAPKYNEGNITSRNLCLFYSKDDTISSVVDVRNFIRGLNVPLLRNVFMDDEPINHLDLITYSGGSKRISKNLLEVLEEATAKQGEHKCKKSKRKGLRRKHFQED